MPASPRWLSLCLLLGASTALAREPSVEGEPFTARMVASIDRQLNSARPQPSKGSARSENDKFDDDIRGVDKVDDPYWGASQHSSTEKYPRTDGYGSYRNSSAGDYDPNRSEKGQWTLMPSTK